jgi:hypothetical protein
VLSTTSLRRFARLLSSIAVLVVGGKPLMHFDILSIDWMFIQY